MKTIADKLKRFIPFSVLLFIVFVITFPEACTSGETSLESKHQIMIENDLKARGIDDPTVISAMQDVKRHLFIDKRRQRNAYGDYPLPIGEGQTISQPYIVGLMTQSLQLKSSDRVLEIGTGSGYQAAVLAEIVKDVYSIEIKEKLAQKAAELLSFLGYTNVTVKAGDGYYGWEEYAPFDAIIVTCAAEKIPPPLIEQLKEGGKIILPLGRKFQIQNLILGIKKGNTIKKEDLIPVRFVPMTGKIKDN
jgi:protein-L-isoaspartate(D-aspartate) O-methyltransferase